LLVSKIPDFFVVAAGAARGLPEALGTDGATTTGFAEGAGARTGEGDDGDGGFVAAGVVAVTVLGGGDGATAGAAAPIGTSGEGNGGGAADDGALSDDDDAREAGDAPYSFQAKPAPASPMTAAPTTTEITTALRDELRVYAVPLHAGDVAAIGDGTVGAGAPTDGASTGAGGRADTFGGEAPPSGNVDAIDARTGADSVRAPTTLMMRSTSAPARGGT
jgi:hypothetical protein